MMFSNKEELLFFDCWPYVLFDLLLWNGNISIMLQFKHLWGLCEMRMRTHDSMPRHGFGTGTYRK